MRPHPNPQQALLAIGLPKWLIFHANQAAAAVGRKIARFLRGILRRW